MSFKCKKLTEFGQNILDIQALKADDFKNQVEYVNEAYIGSQFDTLQTFAMKKTNISEKDHKE